MQGSQAVIEVLNEVLTAELTAVNQYFIHSKMCENWGYGPLAERFHHESIDEMKDADSIIERILFLEGHPNMQRLGSISVGESVKEMFEVDLELEKAAVERYNRAIEIAVAESDNGTRAMLEEHLREEETHADWMEAQHELIEQVGLPNYLAERID